MSNDVDDTLPRELLKPRLRRDEASQYLLLQHGLTVAKATLAKMASVGGGPQFEKLGQTPYYPREQIDAWAVARLGPLRTCTPYEEREERKKKRVERAAKRAAGQMG